MHFWGRLGTDALAASSVAESGMGFSLVFIYGLQQAAYTMVPQAMGASNNQQVGALLCTMLVWTCIIVAVPVAVLWSMMGTILYAVGADKETTISNRCTAVMDEYNVTASNATAGWAPHGNATASNAGINIPLVESYTRACLTFLLPYVAVTTAVTWDAKTVTHALPMSHCRSSFNHSESQCSSLSSLPLWPRGRPQVMP